MLFVLAGPSYVGKKTAISHFMKLYSFSSIIPYTTKPVKRQAGEVEGIKYHFVDPANAEDINNDDFVHDCPFRYKNNQDSVIYAYKKSDIEQAISSYSNFIIHASARNSITISKLYRKQSEGHLYIIFLDYDSTMNEAFFKEKFKKMDSQYYNDGDETVFDNTQFKRRYNHARNERKVHQNNRKCFDEIIKGNQPYLICDRLEDYILPKLMVMPTSPDRIPGPLSDDDIVYMLEKRQKDRLVVKKNNVVLSAEEIQRQNRLSGCTIQLSLAETIRVIKKPFIHDYIDMGQDEQTIEAKLSDIYIEKNISAGYILKPNETILCSSDEHISMPHDSYAIVSSRFSYTQLGLSIELGTSIIQPGHDGRVHFQIKNDTDNSICIYPGIQVVQLVLFRTIQPSSSIYRDNIGTHAYDNENISPISGFRRNNSVLSDVKKPRNNFFKSVKELFESKLVEAVVGLLFLSGAFVAFATHIEELLNNYIVPIWSSNPVWIKCLFVAFASGFFSNLINCIGKIILYLLHYVHRILREKTR